MKINTLQILRALAAISVLITHVFQKLEYKPFGDYYLSGQYGVDIFFILSGFLIYLTTKKEMEPKLYAKKRIFRIYPLYIFAFIMYVIFGVGKYPFDYTSKSFFQNVLMLPWIKSIGYDSLIVGVAWSTVFEMFFYSLFLFIIIFNLSKKTIFIIIPVLFIVSQLILRLILGFGTEVPFLSLFLSLAASTHLFMFLVGCIISELFIKNKIPLLNRKLYTFLLLLFFVLAGFMLMLKWNIYNSFLICTFLFTLTIQFERYHQLRMKTGIVKLLIYLGDISFSIYIFHVFFIKIFIEYLGVDDISMLMVLTLLSTIIFSSLTYKYIEKPFIEFSKGGKGLFYKYKFLLKK